MANIKKFLLYFAQEFVEFRYPEIESIVKLFNLDVKLPDVGPRPYWIVENVNESDLKKIASRSVSLRYIFEVWGSGRNYKEFHDNLKIASASIDKQFVDSCFRITVETYNKHIKHSEKIERIESMNYLPLNGKIDLKAPDNNFIYFEFWGLDPMNVPLEPEEIIFGRWITDGQRDSVKTISLKTRKFIGNTSMNPLLSLLMANQGLCDKNQLMFDPFAGTGSLLIAAAKFGSFVFGSDIDYMMLHGKSKPSRVQQRVREKDESIKMNMLQYNIQHLFLDVFVGDFSNCPLSDDIQFDSIITDPPYGIREAMETIVAKKSRKTTVMTEDAIHYPSTSAYSFKRMFDDLLEFSAKHLKVGGRMVCWFPCTKEDYNEDLLPQHSALKLIANSEQKLTAEAMRRLLTYEKVSETGELIDAEGLEALDFRLKYFGKADEKRQEKRLAKYHSNMQEAHKRGKPFVNKMEASQLANKKLLLARDEFLNKVELG